MKRRTKITVWAVWHLAVWLSFGVLEARAIRSGQHTLSEWTRVGLGCRDTRRGRRVAQVAFTTLMVWFWGHILLDWGPYLDENRRVVLRPVRRQETTRG